MAALWVSSRRLPGTSRRAAVLWPVVSPQQNRRDGQNIALIHSREPKRQGEVGSYNDGAKSEVSDDGAKSGSPPGLGHATPCSLGEPSALLAPSTRYAVQFAAGAILQHSAIPTPLIEHEDEHGFDAPRAGK
jgi:hypothetical protein